jgi:site-specific recombinase XerD
MCNEIDQMARDLALKGYIQSTQDQYLKTARHLRARFGRAASELSRENLREYVAELQAQHKSVFSLCSKLCAVLFLYRRTLGRPDLVSFISLPKRHSPLPEVLAVKEVNGLLNAIENPRYQAVAMVMYGTGMRISEARVLEVRDIDGARGVMRVRHGKDDKAREVMLSRELYCWLRRYWVRHQPARPYLFATRSGQLPDEKSFRKALKQAAKAAFIKKRVTPHTLRHSFATHLLEQGTDVHVVRELLGHASLRGTARYASVTRKIVRQTPSPLDLLPQKRW